MKKIDLHIHTIFSDGNLSPEKVVKLAKENGLSAISITDHDGVGGVELAQRAGEDYGIEVVPGVELSSQKEGKSIHILGYFIDLHNQELIDFFQYMREARLKRAEKIVLKLKEHGVNIEMKEVLEHSGQGGIGRPHIAEVLVEKGIVSNFRETFYKYLGDGKSCYVQKANISTKSVIELIDNSCGIAILAHPSSPNVDKFIPELVDEGLMGIEVWYPSHSHTDIERYLRLANKYNLVPTGGSDSHGERAGYPKIGEFCVEYEILEKLKIKRGK